MIDRVMLRSIILEAIRNPSYLFVLGKANVVPMLYDQTFAPSANLFSGE